MTIGDVLALAGVVLLGAMAPGPDFAVVLRHALGAHGRRAGIAAASGIAAGIAVWAAVAAVGLAGLLAASATVFTLVKLAGAGYLGWLGARSLYAAARPGPGAAPGSQDRQRRRAFTDGLLTNLLNPKAAVFFLALWPQFVPAGSGFGDDLVLVAVTTTVTLAWFSAVGSTLGALAHVLTRRIRRVIDLITGLVLIGLGVRVATQP